MEYKIKNANACYTGGGIYIYYGQLENGLYFRACDDIEVAFICDIDASGDDADYEEFYEAHCIEWIENPDFKTFFNTMIEWIVKNEPKGNYLACELENRIIK